VWIAWATIVAWAGLVGALVAWNGWPATFLVSLLLLWTGFECVLGLHLGVERVGRYLQAFHEAPDGPRPGAASWESAAMAYSDRHRGRGPDALFTLPFLAATALNGLPIVLSALPIELAILGLFHVAFAARLLVARRRAGRLRAVELARFRELHD
jgi:hypothetical protein